MTNVCKPRFADFCSGIITVISVAVTFTLMGVALSWAMQKPYVSYVSFGRTYEKVEGESVMVDTPLAVYTSGAAIYTLRIYSREGVIVYEYEDLQSSAAISTLRTPTTLPAGTYWIGGTVNYQLNPLKNGEVLLNLGTLTVNRRM